MGITEIVEQALQDGYLTPSMEAEVGRICDAAAELSVEEYMALDKLMGSLLTGEVVAVPRKQFINVMEELVLSDAITRVAEIQQTSDIALDVGDRYLDRPEFYPERQAIKGKDDAGVASQLSSLLQDYAPDYEPAQNV